jgi:hypothetical protein
VGTSLTTSRYELGIEVDITARAKDDPLPAIAFEKGEHIVFKLRGVIAAHALPDAADKTDYSKGKTLPPWKTYTIKVVESYADAKDELQGTAEVEFVIEEVTASVERTPHCTFLLDLNTYTTAYCLLLLTPFSPY